MFINKKLLVKSFENIIPFEICSLNLNKLISQIKFIKLEIIY